jgi:hypothetical protein
VAQAGRGLARAARRSREGLAGGLGVSQGLLVEREGAALDDRLGEQPPGAAGDQVGQDRQATGRLTGDGDVVRVAAEPADVVPDPAQRALLVHQPVVAGRAAGPRRQRRVGQKPQGAEPVVDGDGRDAIGRQFGRVVVAAGALAFEDLVHQLTAVLQAIGVAEQPGPARPAILAVPVPIEVMAMARAGGRMVADRPSASTSRGQPCQASMWCGAATAEALGDEPADLAYRAGRSPR